MIHINVYKSTELDDYEKGCLDGTDLGLIDTMKAKTMKEALKKIEEYYGKPYIFDDRLEFDRTENLDGEKPTKAQNEAWTNGDCELYLARYSFYLTEVTTREIKHNELKETFSNLEEY